MSSPTYRIDWDTLSNGGSDDSSSASYQVRDTIGNAAIGGSNSGSYQLRAGYRGGVDDLLLSFRVLPQNNDTQTDASTLLGSVVTVDSTVGYAIGDYALLAQDVGANQVSAFGNITALTPTTLTFDELVDGGTAPVIDGTADSVYLLEGGNLSFDTIGDGDFATAIIGFEATAVSENGYTVQMFDDGNLRDGVNDVDDVIDGTVSTANEEYGGRSSDSTIASSTFDSQDTAITTNPQAISTTASTVFDDRHFVTLKAAVSATTVDGAYSQALTFIVTGNY